MLRKYRRVVIGVAVIVAIQAAAIGIYLIKHGEPRTAVRPFAAETLMPRDAPALAFEDSSGAVARLAGLRGTVVLVHFWATWCPPCRDELPGLLALANDLERGRQFRLLAVSVDDDWDQMREFFAGSVPRGIVRPEIPDAHRRFGASTLPDTYLIDARGRIVIRYAGARDWTSSQAREHLEQAIEAGSP